MAEILEITTLADLQPYQLAWKSLWEQTPGATFFHTYDWFVTFWKHFGQKRTMRILILRSGGKTVGILPLCIVGEQHRLARLRVLTYPLNDWGMWYGPLGPNPSATLFMAMRYLHDAQRDWDVLDLRWSSGGVDDRNATGRAMWAVGWRAQQSVYQQSSLIRFADSTWEEFSHQLSKKWRHEIRRQPRNLAELGPVEFVRHRPQAATAGDGDPRYDLFDECVEVSRGTWQASVTDGNTLCHESVLPFLRESHSVASRLGMVDLALLRVAGRAVAFQYNYHSHGELFGLRMGYLQEMRDWGVGKVLLAQFLEDSFDRQDLQMDLGIGEYDFKSRFRTGTLASYRYTYSPWNCWRWQSVQLAQWFKKRLVRSPQIEPSKPTIA